MKIQKSVSGGEFHDIATFPKPHTDTSSQFTVAVNDASLDVVLKFVSYERVANSLYVDDIEVTGMSDSPLLTVSTSTLPEFTYMHGNGPSDEQSFVVSGTNLTDNISISAPTNFEISAGTGGSFVAESPISLTQVDGSVAETTIYVRLKAGLDIGNYSGENISITSTDADPKTVACSGDVTDSNLMVETFDNLDLTGASYLDGSFTGQDSSTWTYKQCRGDFVITGKAIMIGRSRTPQAYVESGMISNGIGTLSFDYMQAYGTNVNLNVLVNGTVVGNVTSSSQQNEVLNSGEIVVNTPGDFVLKFINVNNGDGQVVIDNITWNTYDTGGDPFASMPVFDPAGGDYDGPISVTISSETAGASIYYTTDGSEPSDTNGMLYAEAIQIDETTTLKAIAYADGYQESSVATAQYNLPVMVNSIAELRGSAQDGTIYRLASEAVLTFQQSFRNQKYIQDATAAILIDDPAGNITTAYNLNDGITGIAGTLSNFGGMLQFTPTQDAPNITSHNLSITPQDITLADVSTNYADYDAQLVRLTDITFDGTGDFANGQVYSINGEGKFRSTFYDVDYIGTAIPATAQNLVGILNSRSEGQYISPRFLGDFEEAVDIPEDTPTEIYGVTVTVTGGPANEGSGIIPEWNNGSFIASQSFILDLIGAGPWSISLETSAPWGAYHRNGEWTAHENAGGFIVFAGIFASKELSLPIILGDSDPTLPVELSSFTAVLTADLHVDIAWTAESETDHAGYNVLRSEASELATAVTINSGLIENGETIGSQIRYNYLDSEVYSATTYYYWLESVSLTGGLQYFGPLSVTVTADGEEQDIPEIPVETKLYSAFPNPFNPSTNLRYSVEEAGGVRIDIFNTKGQIIRTFTDRHEDAGYHQIHWDGRDMNGRLVGTGVYFYRMISGNYNASKKMIMMK